jgi:hypothetical protein
MRLHKMKIIYLENKEKHNKLITRITNRGKKKRSIYQNLSARIVQVDYEFSD